MSKNETIGSAAAAYADKIDYLVGPRHCAAREGFIAGARWQEQQDCGRDVLERELLKLGVDPDQFLTPPGRLVPRMPSVSGVSQTEIMAAIMELGDKISSIAGVLVDVHDDVQKSEAAARDRQRVVLGGIVETQGVIQDVGEKVEAVLSVVTEEPEAVNMQVDEMPKSALQEMWDEIDIGGVVHVGVDMAKPGGDFTAFSVVHNIDWKVSSDQWKAAHHKMHKRAQKAEGELARLRALLKG